MKWVSIPIVVAGFAAGCSPSKELESEMKTNPPVKTPAASTSSTAGSTTTASTAGATTTTTGSTASTGSTSTGSSSTGKGVAESTAGVTTTGGSASTGSTTPAATTPVDTSSDNPNRAFQLRSLDHSTVTVNGHALDVWVMDTKSKRTEGMMFLNDKDVKDNQGMIFVFNGAQPAKDGGFWMKNTKIPLDIIYLAADHKVLNIQEGKPFDTKNLPPSGAYSDVVELKQGQAAKLGIKPGTAMEIPKTLKATE